MGSGLENQYDPNGEYYVYRCSNGRYHWFEGVQCILFDRQEYRFERWWNGRGKPDESVAKPFLGFLAKNDKRFTYKEGKTIIDGEVTARWIRIKPKEGYDQPKTS